MVFNLRLSGGKILCNKIFPNKSHVEKIEQLQKSFEKEKSSIYVLQSTMG